MFKKFTRNFPWKKNKKIKKITLGICAMDKKVRGKPMREILSRLPEELFEIVLFGDDCILNQPIESWPVVEVLIAFYSTNFPTQKALKYVALRNPYMINDLNMDETLKDRRKVYKLLKEQGIDLPFHVFLNREPNADGSEPLNILEEFDEYIIVNGVQINKPLVEKPVNAEDHNIYIYYPMSAGGGSKRLFRKVNDRSSEFYPNINEVRREGSYIYEQFVVTQGTDVKVYTVGEEYGHAEARKSPVVDGRVKRDNAGLEIRYPVILSQAEKVIARKIVQAFRQTVCGFDILRVQGRSYCCDVNGFSFVKNSRKYYDDASQILVDIMLNVRRPEYFISQQNALTKSALTKERLLNMSATPKMRPSSSAFNKDDPQGECSSVQSLDSTVQDSNRVGRLESQEELRCVIAVIRHGDRTPKQKMKIKVTDQRYLDYFHSYSKSPRKDLKVKSKRGLEDFLKLTKEIIAHHQSEGTQPELRRKLCQIRDVLEGEEISGINRKLQMKPQKWAPIVAKPLSPKPPIESPDSHGFNIPQSLERVNSSLSVMSSPEPVDPPATEILMILKWGGDLTPLGKEQAENLGTRFRQINYPDTEGGGVLRLHSTFRHDLKIKASDEGRVMKTAAAFAKGLLELEGQLTPIIASLVTVEDKDRQMLDREGNFEIKEDMEKCKNHLDLLQVDEEMNEDLIKRVFSSENGEPLCTPSLRKSLYAVGNPLKSLKRMHYLIGQLGTQLQALSLEQQRHEDRHSDHLEFAVNNPLDVNVLGDETSEEKEKGELWDSSEKVKNDEFSLHEEHQFKPVHLYLSETLSLMFDRWEKLFKEFYSNKTNLNLFDLTKVPDVYDMIRYDLTHNKHLELTGMEELYQLSSEFESCVVPQEYGIDKQEKRYIGSKMCSALLDKIKHDLQIAQSSGSDNTLYKLDESHAEDLRINSLGRCVRTRLYFTSESHLHTLLNVLRFPLDGKPPLLSDEGLEKLNNISEVSYLSQIVIRLFEDTSKPDSSKFRCEVSFSPGTVSSVKEIMEIVDEEEAPGTPMTPLENLTTPLSSEVDMKERSISDSSDPTKSGLESGIGLTSGTVTPKGPSPTAPYVVLNKNVSFEQLIDLLGDAINLSRSQTEFHEKSMKNGGRVRHGSTATSTVVPTEDEPDPSLTLLPPPPSGSKKASAGTPGEKIVSGEYGEAEKETVVTEKTELTGDSVIGDKDDTPLVTVSSVGDPLSPAVVSPLPPLPEKVSTDSNFN